MLGAAGVRTLVEAKSAQSALVGGNCDPGAVSPLPLLLHSATAKATATASAPASTPAAAEAAAVAATTTTSCGRSNAKRSRRRRIESSHEQLR